MVQQSANPSVTGNVWLGRKSPATNKKLLPTPCWSWGEWHYTIYCSFKKHKCQFTSCHEHKDGFCSPHRDKTVTPKRMTQIQETNPKKKKFIVRGLIRDSVFATFKVDFESCRKYVTVCINNYPVRFYLDTAFNITLILHLMWEWLGKPTWTSTSHVPRSASGNTIQLIGELNCGVSFKNKQFSGVCYITDSSNLNLLGLDFIEKPDLFNKCNQHKKNQVWKFEQVRKEGRKIQLLSFYVSLFEHICKFWLKIRWDRLELIFINFLWRRNNIFHFIFITR